ncbi:hypothetical protein [Tenacibaculum piscium]|uniref:hypothetical protein n=1 Tax=Tenacibaculum piscium TaxID=1458515 RepID=UPI001F329677|nr:hypothetical protein [Tenacibaculum piscium]
MNYTNLNKNQEQATVIVKIITDHIVFTRIQDGMHSVLNCFNPDGELKEFNAEYSGIDTALMLMGVNDEMLIGRLHDSYYNGVFGNSSMMVATELAKVIYVEWLCDIKNHFLTVEKLA